MLKGKLCRIYFLDNASTLLFSSYLRTLKYLDLIDFLAFEFLRESLITLFIDI